MTALLSLIARVSGRRLAAGLVAVLLLGTWAPPVRAAGSVGTCDEPTLAAAVAGGGTVTFACTGTIVLTSTLVLTADTTLDATGYGVTIDGGDAVRLISAPSAVNLTVLGLVLAHGSATNAGAILLPDHSSLTLVGATILDNHATSGAGAIQAPVVTATDTLFVGNGTDDGVPLTVTNAGAVSAGSITVVRGGFINNTADGAGGAINAANVSIGAAGLVPTVFDGNIAGAQAGAVYAGTSLLVENASFANNQAVGSGGAIAADCASVTINTSTFSANHSAADGGAVRAAGDVSLGTDTFSANTAVGDGGAVAAVGSVSVAGGFLTGNSVLFGAGGAVDAADVTVTGATVAANTAATGGAIAASGHVTISGGTVASNSAITGHGGAIQATGVTVTNALVQNNTASGNGGAVSSTGSVTSNGATFTVNSATNGHGGAIDAGSTVTVTGGSLTGNTARVNGGAIHAGSDVTVGGANLDGNTAEGNGGAIQTGGTATVTGASFSGDGAGVNYGGGAIHAENATVTDSVFTSNHAAAGGAVYVFVNVTIDRGRFVGNQSVSYGGAVASANSASVVNSRFTGNSTPGYGGAIRAASTVTAAGTTFEGNSAAGAGSAVAASHLSLVNSTVVGNAGQTSTMDAWDVTSVNVTFVGNTVGSTGAVVHGDNAPVILRNTIMVGTDGDECHLVNGPSANFWDQGGNFIDDASCPMGPWNASHTNVNPATLQLGPLQDNGGLTPTIAIAPTSVAVNAGIGTQQAPCPATDQRGVTRPQGAACDAGAYEVAADLLPVPPHGTSPQIGLSVTASPQTVVAGTSVTFTYTVTNPGAVPLRSIAVSDTACAPVTYASGDTGKDGILGSGEAWVYTCTRTVSATLTDAATASGTVDSTTTIAHAAATVTVLPSVSPPSDTGKTTLVDLIAAGARKTGTTGFGTASVVVARHGYVTYLVTADASLAGARVEIWTRSKTGTWIRATTRILGADGTLRYYVRVDRWTALWAKLVPDATHVAAAGHGRIASCR